MSGDINVQTFSGKVNITSNLLVGSSHLFVDTTNNRVGITTADPDAGLHVNSNAYVHTDFRVGSDIAMNVTSGRITAGSFEGDGSLLENVPGDSGSWVNGTNSNVHLATLTDKVGIGTHSPGAELHVAGTGAIVVPSGTTEQRPGTEVNGMLRYNSQTGYMEAYTASGWAPIAQPPTVTGISPLTTLPSGGIAVGWNTTGTKIVASDAQADDKFGYSVSMNSDGTRLIVGAYAEAPDGVSTAGAAYIFTYDGSNWDAGTKIVASDKATTDYFGYSVSMNSDGTKVIVGAFGEHSSSEGAAYIFTYSSGSWDEGVKIVALDRGTLDFFGKSVAMSGDGTKVIVGAFKEDTTYADVGAAYIFTYDGSNWDAGTKILASDKQGSDYFGNSVAMSGDGTKVIVGAYREDTGGIDNGAAYIFAYSVSYGGWQQQQKIQASSGNTGSADNQFGYSVAMNSDGTKVIVGAHYEDSDAGASVNTNAGNSGAAFIYTYDGSNWGSEVRLKASDAQGSDQFGYSVSMNSDGTKVIVGAYDEDEGASGAGAAYIFALSSGSWSQEVKILASDAQADDRFSHSVAMSGAGDVLVGAFGEDTGGTDAGAAYIFDYQATALFDASTQVFTATGTGIVSGSTVQLEGADGTLYSVVDATAPNAAGTQVTFKMGGSEVVEFPPSAMSTNTSITGYTASSSGNYNYLAWRAFNDVVSTSSYWPAGNGSAAGGYSTSSPYLAGSSVPYTGQHHGHWLQLQIPTPIILSRAVISSTQSGYQHGQFVILGSNDGTNWTLLHTGTGTSLSTDVTTLSAGSTQAFSYFRVVIKSKTSSASNYNIELNNVQFFGKTGSWVLAQQPYKVKVNSTSGLIGTSTAAIGFPTVWTTAVGANLRFDIMWTTTQTLVGTDGGGGTNRTFSVAPGSNALPSGLTLTGSTGAITGQIAANQDGVTTSVTFRLTDNGSGLFTDRAINIMGSSELYAFTSHTFTNATATGYTGPTLANLRAAYISDNWTHANASGGPFLLANTQGIQEWTVPGAGSYTITAAGAGSQNHGLGGGRGRIIQLTVNLTKGEVIKILVGQVGSSSDPNSGNSGGGGTFVMKTPYNSAASVLVIAGGGGAPQGPGWGTQFAGGDAQSTGATPRNTNTGYGANYGSQGSGAGSNGGGLLSDGTSGGLSPHQHSNGSSGLTLTGGRGFINGGNGGITTHNSGGTGTSYGGFGGGGVTYYGHRQYGAGGGGGYTGGASGYYNVAGGEGGGSYYPGGTDQGLGNRGDDGYVTILKN
mgnify:FL=1